MKLAYGIPLLDRMSMDKFEYYIRLLSEIGYSGAEFAVCHPERLNHAEIKLILKKYKMEVSGLRSGGIQLDSDGIDIRFSNPDENIRAIALERMKNVIDFAAILNCSVLMGRIQGVLSIGETLEGAEDLIIKCIRECADYAEKLNVNIMLEPINHFEFKYHNTTREMMKFVDKINEKIENKISLLLDIYHMWTDESSVSAALVYARDQIGHIHFTGIRREIPCSGCMDYPEYIKILEALDYKGYIAMEVFYPEESFENTARVSYNYIKSLIDAAKLAK